MHDRDSDVRMECEASSARGSTALASWLSQAESIDRSVRPINPPWQVDSSGEVGA